MSCHEMKNEFENASKIFQDYVIEAPDKFKGDQNETMVCFGQVYVFYMQNSSIMGACVCPHLNVRRLVKIFY